MKYATKEKDIKFITAIDQIIIEHQKYGITPQKDSTISMAVFGKRNIIAKVRIAQRGVTQSQIEKLVHYFDLDFNYFYKQEVSFIYEVHKQGKKVIIPHQKHTSRDHNYLEIKKSNKGIVYNSQIYIYLDKVRQLAEASLINLPDDYHKTMEAIQSESRQLEQKLYKKTQELNQLETRLNQTILDLRAELSEVVKRENETLRKWLDFHDQNQARQFLTTNNGSL